MGERLIALSGGGPWGFTLSGGKDFGAPLKVSKVSAALFHGVSVTVNSLLFVLLRYEYLYYPGS